MTAWISGWRQMGECRNCCVLTYLECVITGMALLLQLLNALRHGSLFLMNSHCLEACAQVSQIGPRYPFSKRGP
ncbi:hypothetical protein B0H11DRAFT_505532 [Mycena galericulata]|nr:hypothetical protein B0H11DRAFT_505532 [Mycena galericulata]